MSFCPTKEQYHSYREWVNGLIRTRCDFLNTTIHKCRKKQQIYACVNNLKSGIFLYILYISKSCKFSVLLALASFFIWFTVIINGVIYCDILIFCVHCQEICKWHQMCNLIALWSFHKSKMKYNTLYLPNTSYFF